MSVRFTSALLAAFGFVACGSEPPTRPTTTPPPPMPEVITVAITGPSDTLKSFGDTATYSAVVTVDGAVDTTRSVTWASRANSFARSLGNGQFIAANNGDVTIVASVGTAKDSTTVTIAQRATSMGVVVQPDTVFSLDIRTRISVTALDARGNAIPTTFAAPSWTSSDSSVVFPEVLGFARAISGGTAQLSANLHGVSDQADLTVVPSIALEVQADMAEGLQWIIEDSMTAHPAVPGINAAVLFPDGTMWRGVTGISDSSSRFRPEERQALGSTSKTVPSALILQLVDQGVLTLEDSLGQWLPAVTNMPPGVTLRQLLNNSSGIFNFAASTTLGDSILADLNRTWQPLELLQKFLGPINFPAGQQYTSSSTGFLILGMVAEAATSTPASQEIRSRFWTPLGLTAPYEGRDEMPTGPVAAGWWPGLSGNQLEDFNSTLLGPAIHSTRWMMSGIWTNAEDLARWGRAYFDGSLFSAGLMTEILTALPDNSGFIPGQIGAGLGIRRYNYLGREQWGHSGATSGSNSLLIWDRQSGIVVAIQINASGSVHGSQHFWIGPALLQRALQG